MQFVSGRIFDVAGVEVEGWVNSMDWGVIIHVRGHRIQLILGNLRVSILLMQRANFLWGFLVVFIEVNVFSLCVKVRIVDLRSQDEKSVTLVIESSGGRKSGTELFCRSDERSRCGWSMWGERNCWFRRSAWCTTGSPELVGAVRAYHDALQWCGHAGAGHQSFASGCGRHPWLGGAVGRFRSMRSQRGLQTGVASSFAWERLRVTGHLAFEPTHR